MLLRIFKTSQPLSWILIILILTVVRFILFLFFYNESFIPLNQSVTSGFIHYLSGNLPILSHFVSLLIIIPSGFLFNKIAQDVNLFKGIHYLVFLFFGLFSVFDPVNLVLSPMLLSLPLILFGLAMILKQSKGKISLPNVFNASFLIGLATLIYPANFLVFIMLIISIFYINNANWRSILVAIVGVITPWVFHDTILFSFAVDAPPFKETLNQFFGRFTVGDIKMKYGILVLTGLILLQLPKFFSVSAHSIIKIRKSLFLMLYYLLLGIAVSGFLTDSLQTMVSIIIIPVSILFTVFQLETKKWWIGDVVFLGLIASITLNYMNL